MWYFRQSRPTRQLRHRRVSRQTPEQLEERVLLTLTFNFDYTYDTADFFDTSAKRDVLELAGQIIGAQLSDELEAINPSGSNTWSAVFPRPDTGASISRSNMQIDANELVVFVGARELGTTVGNGGFGGYSASGSSSWLRKVDRRGQSGAVSNSDFGPWGGQIAFDITTNWHFGETIVGLTNSETDFLSVALHELSHLMGFGLAGSWTAQVNGNGQFTGSDSVAEHGSNVPLAGSESHWAAGLNNEGRETAMDPGILRGDRKLLTPLDWAAFADIGWEVDITPMRDWGDAPNSQYPTNQSSNGARHTLGSGLELGTTADWEADGQPSASANGDDTDGLNDDDGVTFEDALQAGSTAAVTVVTTQSGGRLDAWIDFNGDGDWADANEQIFANEPLDAGTNGLTISVPAGATTGETYARFRLSSSGGLSYTGAAADGEVEDYRIDIVGEIAAIDDSYSTSGTRDLDVLNNDLPEDNVRILDFDQPNGGTVTTNFDGTLEFDPDAGFSGVTTFDYTVAFGQERVVGSSTETLDEFGHAVALFEDIALVGVPNEDNNNGEDAGAVYIFQQTGQDWLQIKKLTASDGIAKDRFGYSVAIDGETVVVGARQADVHATNDGAVYIFERDQGGNNNWGLVQKITGSGNSSKDHFGHAVAIDGNTVVVGARLDDGLGTNSGSAYIFERNLGGTDNWGERLRIKASDAAGGDQFGFAVAIDGKNVVIGARKDDDAGVDSGSVYFLNRDAGGSHNWGEFNKFTASDGVKNDWFGFSVDIDGAYAVIGKPIRTGKNRTGAAYIFRKDGPSWSEQTSFQSVSGKAKNQFGHGVAISGNTVVVGARSDDGGAINSGLAAVHTRGTGGSNNWGLDYEIYGDNAVAGDYLGESVAFNGTWVVMGAPRDDDNGSKSGTVAFQDIAMTDDATVTIAVASGGASSGNGDDSSGDGGGSSANMEDDSTERRDGRWLLTLTDSESHQQSSRAGSVCCCASCVPALPLTQTVSSGSYEEITAAAESPSIGPTLAVPLTTMDSLFTDELRLRLF